MPVKYRDTIGRVSRPYYESKVLPNNVKLYHLNITIDDLDIDFGFNDKLFEDYMEAYEDYQRSYQREHHKLQRQFEIDLGNAYKTYLSKIYMEFGQQLAPVFDYLEDAVSPCDPLCVANNCNGPFDSAT